MIERLRAAKRGIEEGLGTPPFPVIIATVISYSLFAYVLLRGVAHWLRHAR